MCIAPLGPKIQRRLVYDIHIIIFSKNYRNVIVGLCSSQSSTDSYCSAYADVLEHTSHTAYRMSKTVFFITSSSVVYYLLIQPSIKGNAGPIVNVLERFYNVYSTVSQ